MERELALVRAAHVLGVVLWIGGVAFVTTVLLPGLKREHPPSRRLAAFLRLESSFAWQARAMVLVVGISGVWMAQRLDLWSRFASPQAWWMHAMVGVWSVFALMLFVLEPLFLHRRLERSTDPVRSYRRLQLMHWGLLLISLIAAGGAVAGAHGL